MLKLPVIHVFCWFFGTSFVVFLEFAILDALGMRTEKTPGITMLTFLYDVIWQLQGFRFGSMNWSWRMDFFYVFWDDCHPDIMHQLDDSKWTVEESKILLGLSSIVLPSEAIGQSWWLRFQMLQMQKEVFHKTRQFLCGIPLAATECSSDNIHIHNGNSYKDHSEDVLRNLQQDCCGLV